MPKASTRVRDLNIVIGVVSCLKYQDRLQACLSTWVADLQETSNAQIVQVLGDPNQREWFAFDRDLGRLTLKCPDTYEALALKSQLFFKWVLEHTNADYVFKCDDDTFVNAPLFLDLELAGLPYIGYPIEKPELEFIYGSGGAGYFLNRTAMNAVVQSREFAREPYEDLGVGKFLFKSGIAFTKNHQLVPSRNFWDHDFVLINDEKFPSAEYVKRHVTIHLHRMDASAMDEVYLMLKS